MQTRTMVEDVKGIRGLICVPNYLSEYEEADLLDLIDHKPWSNDMKRRVQYYGHRYTDQRRQGLPGYTGNLPGWLLALADRLHYDGFSADIPDQCAINEYTPGQGISTHVDNVASFGDTVLLLSLGSPCVMEFSHSASPVKIPVLLEPRSLMVLTGPARYQWKHGIAARKTDHYNGYQFARARRVSITFRTLLVDTMVAASLKYA